jgi:hypothetical protein
LSSLDQEAKDASTGEVHKSRGPNLGDEVGKSATQSTREVSSTGSVSTSYGPAGIADELLLVLRIFSVFYGKTVSTTSVPLKKKRSMPIGKQSTVQKNTQNHEPL